jgi:hypothetical protein
MGQVHPAKSPLLKAICLWWKARYVLSAFFSSSSPSTLFFPSALFFFYSFPPPQMSGWANTLPMPDLIFLKWLQASPHQERSAKEVVVAWVSRKPPGSAKDPCRLACICLVIFFFSKFCCFWYFAKVSQAHAGLKRSLLGMHSEDFWSQ